MDAVSRRTFARSTVGTAAAALMVHSSLPAAEDRKSVV